MSGVKNNAVIWRVEDFMNRNCGLNNTEVGAQVATGFGYLGNKKFSDFLGKLEQLLVTKALQVLGAINRI